ncbi:DUF342 domain-containing protein [Alkalicoccus daliensis]|uniref:Flagellar Assembly Protein A N-terminal region domain-containing protein n=1 Tax=Alkalicoccus daliensis TaxID=745820 RepID=A0A1H0A6P4_9BACI|nr:FapA family protein [Alkalicoccus daliensis]SDN28894.1 hypothetical protein SAMN04488053_101364 [Alkalicoccus daliensis]
MDLQEYFKVEISKDKLSASLKLQKDLDKKIMAEDLKEFLESNGVVHGIKEDAIKQVLENSMAEPVKVAAGTPPHKGNDARLLSVSNFKKDKADQLSSVQAVNLREVIDIPMVEAGEKVAEKVPPESGRNGLGVDGSEIAALKGKDFKLRPGKNTILSDDELFLTAETAGQLSVEANKVHVYSVFEVNGDLDLKTGNIKFNGNVTIHGNVPSGFKVTARGDIRINGSVEAADLEAEGNIYITHGVVAQGAGSINAQGQIAAGFLNEANVTAAGDITIEKSILHSNTATSGLLTCTAGRGNIVGGSVSSGKGIKVNEIGNRMHTQTSIYLGAGRQAKEMEKKFNSQKKESIDTLKKLKILRAGLEKKQNTASLTAREEASLHKIYTSIDETLLRYQNAVDILEDLEEVEETPENASVKIHKICYPNTEFHFGKYMRKVLEESKSIELTLEDSEIKINKI